MSKFYKSFIPLILILFCLSASAENYTPVKLTDRQNYAMNLFLSNFTEVGVQQIDCSSDEKALVDFAHDHLWFNSYDSFEYGDYFGDNNCRVSDERISEIIHSYFLYPYENVDLSQTRFDYDGEYYYHCETGGWNDYGFAHALNVYPIGHDQYFVSFAVFCSGESWNNDVMNDELSELLAAYGEPYTYGSALIYAETLSERSSYRLISYSLV